MPDRVTIKDIAARLGISHSTVSRALADHPGTNADTKARVRAVASELGYVAHSAARTMRGARSALVGLLIPDVRNAFYATVAKVMAETCNRAGLQLVLAITEDDPESERRHVRALAEARAAGIVLVPSATVVRETRDLLSRTPLVQIVRRAPALASDWMGIDDAAALEAAVHHLLALGHRRIGYVGGAVSLSSGRERLRGYRAALEGAGIGLDAALEATGPPRARSGREGARRLLGAAEPPSAIVTGGLRIAVGVLDAVREAGIAVPDALSLVGFGDGPPFQWWGQGTTTIELPAWQVASAAADLLVRRIEEERAGAGPRAPFTDATFQSRLVVRGSTGAPRATHPGPAPSPGHMAGPARGKVPAT